MYDILKNSLLFKSISEDEIKDALDQLDFVVKDHLVGEVILHMGDHCGSLMILLRGKIKGEMVEFSGKVVKIEEMEPADILAGAFLYGENSRCPVNIVALQDSSILKIPKHELMKLFHLKDKTLENYLDYLSSKAQFLSKKMRFLTFTTIKSKLAHIFMTHHKQSASNSFKLQQSQSELAHMFGVAQPSVARGITEMVSEGLIESKRGEIIILDLERLKGLLE